MTAPVPVSAPSAAVYAVGTNLELVKQKYKASLANLTFNSKPIITNLTIAAQENIAAAKQIVQAIEEHLRSAHPTLKLCIVYLIDSICKNIGGVYIPLFSRNLVHTFLDVYAVVDEDTQKRLDRVLGTWQMGPSGKPVFDLAIIGAIENGVAKKKSASMRYQQVHYPQHALQGRPSSAWSSPAYTHSVYASESYSSYPAAPTTSSYYDHGYSSYTVPQPTPAAVASIPFDKGSLLSEIQALLILTQQRAAQGDALAANRVVVLQQLQQLVETQVLPATQMSQIKQHISTLWAEAGMTPPPQSRYSSGVSYAENPSSQYPASSTPSYPYSNGPAMPQMLSNVTAMPLSQSRGGTPTPASVPLANASTFGINSVAGGPSASVSLAPTDLVKNLMSFGLLSSLNPASSTPDAKGPSAYESSSMSSAVTTTSTVRSLSELGPIDLTSESISRRREGAHELLYTVLPSQCKQCGFRFPNTPDGQRKMDDHLDWHFRQNRRAKDKAGKSQSRGWFVVAEAWIHSREGDSANNEHAPFFDANQAATSKPSAESEAARAEEAALRQKTIVQPDAEAAGRPCPICKEVFENFFNDAEEEWYLRNAIDVDGTIYHATCHADASKASGFAKDATVDETETSPSQQLDSEQQVKSEPVQPEPVKTESSESAQTFSTKTEPNGVSSPPDVKESLIKQEAEVPVSPTVLGKRKVSSDPRDADEVETKHRITTA